jgi:nicotinamide-nucleotide amidase
MSSIDTFLIGKANAAVRQLKAKKLTVVTAESCTAGLIAACVARGKGASDVLEGGFVTYTKAQKHEALGVPKRLLAENSVTAKVAEAMAKGALRSSKADIGLSVTGVLGPACDEDGNPVGRVFICCLRRGGIPFSARMDYGRMPHDRMRRQVVIEALKLLALAAK